MTIQTTAREIAEAVQGAVADETERLTADLMSHVKMVSDQAQEIKRLRAERDDLLQRVQELEADFLVLARSSTRGAH